MKAFGLVLLASEALLLAGVSLLSVSGVSFAAAAAAAASLLPVGCLDCVEASGAAAFIADLLLAATLPFGPRATLAGVYLLGAVFASFVSNTAAAALMFPVAMNAAVTAGLDTRAIALGLALAASAGFATPIGSNPNLLVYGPGGYRYLDFTRVGLPLSVLCMVLAVVLLPMAWPL